MNRDKSASRFRQISHGKRTGGTDGRHRGFRWICREVDPITAWPVVKALFLAYLVAKSRETPRIEHVTKREVLNMATVETSDSQVLDLLRRHGPLAIGDLTERMGVTRTAVRQRLARLIDTGLIQRGLGPSQRGRPSHRYSLTDEGHREAGHNFGDLAMALWREVRSVKDPEVRNGLLKRVAKSVAEMYADRVTATAPAERMQQVAELMSDRNVPFSREGTMELPVLTAWACPYPALAEEDRGICAMENMVFTELVGAKVKLSECRLDGGTCCRFQTS